MIDYSISESFSSLLKRSWIVQSFFVVLVRSAPAPETLLNCHRSFDQGLETKCSWCICDRRSSPPSDHDVRSEGVYHDPVTHFLYIFFFLPPEKQMNSTTTQESPLSREFRISLREGSVTPLGPKRDQDCYSAEQVRSRKRSLVTCRVRCQQQVAGVKPKTRLIWARIMISGT